MSGDPRGSWVNQGGSLRTSASRKQRRRLKAATAESKTADEVCGSPGNASFEAPRKPAGFCQEILDPTSIIF